MILIHTLLSDVSVFLVVASVPKPLGRPLPRRPAGRPASAAAAAAAARPDRAWQRLLPEVTLAPAGHRIMPARLPLLQRGGLQDSEFRPGWQVTS